MGRDSGRSGKPGNMKGTPGKIHIAMKDPNAHKKLSQKKSK
jgi:hypothetical protein